MRPDIGLRLTNWGAWEANNGQPGVNAADAREIAAALVELPAKQQQLLRMCYVHQAAPDQICRAISIPLRPPSAFVDNFFEAQRALRDILTLSTTT